MSQPPTEPVRVLHVDDEPGFGDMAAAFLEREDRRFDVVTETSASAGLDRLDDGGFECVVSDYDMPGRNGLEFLEAVRDDFPDLPFVLFTGKGSEEIASEAISAGVTDYLEKRGGTDQYTLLANRVGNAVERYRSGRAVEERNRRLETLIDSLPGMVYRCRDEPGFPMEFVGGECEELTGYAASDLEEGRVLWGEDLVRPADRNGIWRAIRGATDAGEPFEITYRITAADGTEKWVWERGQEIRSDDDGATTLEGFIADITERKERERDLERYETILEAVGDSVYALDADGRYTYVNEAFVEATGYGKERALGEHASLALAEESIEAGREVVRELLADDDRTEATVEMERITADGERIPIENTMVLLPSDEEGEFGGSAGVARDVTERKERERDLERYETIVEAMGDGVYALDADGGLIEANDQLAEMTGYDGAEFAGVDPEHFLDGEDLVAFERAIHDLVDADDRTVVTVETELHRRDGGALPVEVNLTLLPGEGFSGTIGVVRDVTERKERERDLEQYETIVETVPVGVGVIDGDGIIVGGNRRAGEILGYDMDDLIGESFERLVEEDVYDEGFADDYRERIRELLSDDADGGYAGLEYSITVDGEERHVETRVALRPGGEGHRGTISVFWDVTERERRRRELLRQNERLEEFAGIVSHDLRSPLAVLDGSLELAEEDGAAGEFERCRRAIGRMEELIDDLLALARAGDRIAETEAVDLAEAVDGCRRTVDTAGVDVRIDTDRTIRADGGRLRQLLENLIRNAIEHGGEDVTITVGDLDGRAGFFVEDDGAGLPEDSDGRAFESGYSTAEGGTGFGLAIVKRIADAHGWAVAATEREGGGARFEITGVEAGE